jgi:hypothetical protein
MERYDLRLLGPGGETLRIYQLHCSCDEPAKKAILSIPDAYARYELWRGMECIASGGRFIVAGVSERTAYLYGGPPTISAGKLQS